MKKHRLLSICILTCLLCLPYLKAGQQADELYTRRFALLVGANDGGEDRVTLRYAVDDAKAVQKVLEEMGGILPDDSRFLAEPSRNDQDAGETLLVKIVFIHRIRPVSLPFHLLDEQLRKVAAV